MRQLESSFSAVGPSPAQALRARLPRRVGARVAAVGGEDARGQRGDDVVAVGPGGGGAPRRRGGHGPRGLRGARALRAGGVHAAARRLGRRARKARRAPRCGGFQSARGRHVPLAPASTFQRAAARRGDAPRFVRRGGRRHAPGCRVPRRKSRRRRRRRRAVGVQGVLLSRRLAAKGHLSRRAHRRSPPRRRRFSPGRRRLRTTRATTARPPRLQNSPGGRSRRARHRHAGPLGPTRPKPVKARRCGHRNPTQPRRRPPGRPASRLGLQWPWCQNQNWIC
mmetsp:Transcript_19652/g.67706  ORF Transcript_19652/g.67706 Transcript_19652/m.67706 type:complete len:280 (+) Transcript_19652:3244-4083(+)